MDDGSKGGRTLGCGHDDLGVVFFGHWIVRRSWDRETHSADRDRIDVGQARSGIHALWHDATCAKAPNADSKFPT